MCEQLKSRRRITHGRGEVGDRRGRRITGDRARVVLKSVSGEIRWNSPESNPQRAMNRLISTPGLYAAIRDTEAEIQNPVEEKSVYAVFPWGAERGRDEAWRESKFEMEDRRSSIANSYKARRGLSMVVVSDGTNPGATARGGMLGVEMCG